MIVFWTIAKSAVFPIIVVSKNKTYPEFILYGWSFIEFKYSNILRYLFLTFINCKLQSSKLTHKKRLKCFNFHVMNLKYEKMTFFTIF